MLSTEYIFNSLQTRQGARHHLMPLSTSTKREGHDINPTAMTLLYHPSILATVSGCNPSCHASLDARSLNSFLPYTQLGRFIMVPITAPLLVQYRNCMGKSREHSDPTRVVGHCEQFSSQLINLFIWYYAFTQ